MNYLILGAGLMGRAAARDLLGSGGRVVIIDKDEAMLKEAKEFAPGADTESLGVEETEKLRPLLQQADGALSCVPYFFNHELSSLCTQTKTHFVDLGGNNDVVDAQFELDKQAREAGISIIPDCGLAPGMLSIFAMEGANSLDECHRISMYCGGLPQKPKPMLNYMRLFSINGLINEYVEPVRILKDGVLAAVEGMSGLEMVEFEQPWGGLEAFYTSGGTSTLVDTLKGRVEELEYKTLRYPGHIRFFQTLRQLGFLSDEAVKLSEGAITPRQLTQRLLHENLPSDEPDVTLFRVDCEGVIEEKPVMIRFECIDLADEATGTSSMMRCTAYPAAIILRMLVEGTIPSAGVHPQELVVPPELFRKELHSRGIIVEKMVSDEYEEVID